MIERTYECQECGVTFTRTTNRKHRFCCKEHKIAFNHRRLLRGAELYDLLMEMRYGKGRLNANECRALMQRLGRSYRDADKAFREGRQSWLPIETVKDGIPLAFSTEGDKR